MSLQCLRGRACNSNNPSLSVDALIFLDPGSTTSYISTSLSFQLKLSCCCSEVLKFNAFADLSSRELKTDLVYFNLNLFNGIKFNISAQTAPYIGLPIPLT